MYRNNLIKICNSLDEDPPETAKAGSIWYFTSVGYGHFPVE